MRNFDAIATVCIAVALSCVALPAVAQDGYLAQRFDAAPAGAGWLLHDDLKLGGGLGGAISLTSAYGHTPSARADGSPVITDHARANIGMAVLYSRFRLSFDLASPLYVRGSTTPLDIASHPDTITDVRIGVDGRIWGDIDGPLRVGASAHLFVPSADRSDYMSDGTYRALLRVLLAGDISGFTYAANAGFHVRPWMGHEVTAGVAAGWRIPFCATRAAVFGVEYAHASQIQGATQTFDEALVSGRFEWLRVPAHVVRLKIGVGGGHDLGSGWGPHAAIGIEVVGLATDDTETQ